MPYESHEQNIDQPGPEAITPAGQHQFIQSGLLLQLFEIQTFFCLFL